MKTTYLLIKMSIQSNIEPITEGVRKWSHVQVCEALLSKLLGWAKAIRHRSGYITPW